MIRSTGNGTIARRRLNAQACGIVCCCRQCCTYNLSHGPWDGPAWFEKLREGAADYWSKAEAGDPLLEILYEPLRLDFQEEAVGTPDHKLQVLNQAVDSNVVRKKGHFLHLCKPTVLL